MFQCKDLMRLSTFASVKIIGGQAGLSNTIRWAYKVEEMAYGKWIKGRELLVISNGIAKHPDFDLYELIKTAIQHRTAGALLLMGKGYVEDVPKEVITLVNRYDFPLFTMPWSAIPLVELFEDLGHAIAYRDNLENEKDDILANILFGHCDSCNEDLRHSKVKKYGLERPYKVFTIHFFSDKGGMSIERDYILGKLNEIFNAHQVPVLVTKYGSNYVGLFHAEGDGEIDWEGIKNSIHEFVDAEYEEWSFIIGVGSSYNKLSEMQISFKEATQCMALSHRLNGSNCISFYDQLGFYNLLLHINDDKILKAYYRQILGTLLDYDKENKTDLIKTLKTFIKANGHILETSKLLFVHRNTVKYRIKRIEELTGKNLEVSASLTQFHTAIMTLDYLREASY